MKRGQCKLRIKWIEFENIESGLSIERIEFNDNMNLLVGLSGAGKTQILQAIEGVMRTSVGAAARVKPFNASVVFEIGEDSFEWKVRMKKSDSPKDNFIDVGQKKSFSGYVFEYERLVMNNELIFERSQNVLTMKGYDRLPVPNGNISVLEQYRGVGDLYEIVYNIINMSSMDIEYDVRNSIGKEEFDEFIVELESKVGSFGHSNNPLINLIPTICRLQHIKENQHELYNVILASIQDIFNEIDEVDVVYDASKNGYVMSISVYEKQLLQDDISNGMLKTIHHIINLYTLPKGSVVLIDEFENGLGVNCIDVLSELLINERDDLQFIITSHHPKIINGINKEDWKIIEREGSVIKNYTYEQYGIGHSQHDAYFNLLSKWEYEGKI